MNLGVSDRFTIVTNLSVDEALQRLASVIEPPKRQWFGMLSSWKRKPYEGTISGNTFRISRVINYRNSFVPVIEGEIYEGPEGASIEISMNLNTLVLAFMIFWLAVVGSFCIFALRAAISAVSIGWFTLLPILMFVFGIAMTVGGFSVEADKSKKFLCGLFEQEISSAART
jgi:hypothetical protein